MITILQGDALTQLRTLPDASVNCCVTSPPYWGLRDYGISGQLGLEASPEEYVDKVVALFREVRRVLRDDGTLWLNLGDTYSRAQQSNVPQTKDGTVPSYPVHTKEGSSDGAVGRGDRPGLRSGGLAPKQLIGIPWRVAFALQADGWYLRSDIIWAKKNTMPESVTDRPTKSHEHIFLLAKSQTYFYDHEAILEPCSDNTHARISQDLANQIGSWRANGGGKTNGPMKPVATKSKVAPAGSGIRHNESYDASVCMPVISRNKRDVWFVGTQPYSEAHFATFPPDLIKPCILAGCPVGGTVLDPFGGSGTTGMVSLELGRKAILIELNPEYCKLAETRCNVTPGLALV